MKLPVCSSSTSSSASCVGPIQLLAERGPMAIVKVRRAIQGPAQEAAQQGERGRMGNRVVRKNSAVAR
jgi:hypothetical protein